MPFDAREVRPLPEFERQRDWKLLLDVLQQHPDLAHFRAAVPAEHRQLALCAALERHAVRGAPNIAPPAQDDHADQLLCDILDTIDCAPETARMGSAYGPDRHQANLRGLGVWEMRPRARELFTTLISPVSAEAPCSLLAAGRINSPPPQDAAQNGELIASNTAGMSLRAMSETASQTHGGTLVVPAPAAPWVAPMNADGSGNIHHQPSSGGELIAADNGALNHIAARPVRRGRPRLIDELAKGRLLGLMAYGLSCRQAAAQLGVHHTAVSHLMKRDEPFAQQVAEARHEAMAQPLTTVIRASRTSWRAAAWLARFLDERNKNEEELK